MYSIPENLDDTEYNGWINQNLLLKNSRRQTSRKRTYDLANVDIDDESVDLRRRVLRPRHNCESQSSSGASRTRPIRSNRTQPRHMEHRTSTQNVTPATDASTHVSANNLPLFHTQNMYNWPQNNLIAHADPSSIYRSQPSLYFHLSQSMPHLDPWILHNYLLASSTYTSISPNGHLPMEVSNDPHNTNMTQLGFSSMIPENVLNQNSLWHYPFILHPTYNPLQSQVTRPPELVSNTSSHNVDSHPDLSHLFRTTNMSHSDITSNSHNMPHGTDRAHSRMYQNEHYNNNILPTPFSYGSLCPYHNINHIMQSHSLGIGGNAVSDPGLPQYNSYRNQSDMTFGHYWHQMNPTLRPVNYPVNSSNIDTLLHLAAHFEQRKRGITREELEKLPTHRHKVISKKQKLERTCTDKVDKVTASDDTPKCLVCLDEFESKQSIRTLHCTHEFHAKCIDKWLKINRTCPLCRADAFDGSTQKDLA